MRKAALAGFFLLAFAAALVFRTASLGLRPMHHDEANQALKFGALLETGEYLYDRADHHGPTLYYVSLPVAWTVSQRTLAALTEKTLRAVPACFGIGTILALLLFLPLAGRQSVAWAGLFLALSPVMVYFSRFYIQETLLVFFLVGFMAAVWRYIRQPAWTWAAAAGLAAGLMYATKETSIIAFGSVSAALALTFLTQRKGKTLGAAGTRLSHGILGLAVALFVSFLLFSSFFQNPQGFLDSIFSFKVYFIRAGEAGFHIHPWSYYLHLLTFSRAAGGPPWTEALIIVLALVGAVAAFRTGSRSGTDHSFLRFLVFYTALATAAYSLIPYKTPWNLLPFDIGFILLAGCGAVALFELFRRKAGRLTVSLLIAAGCLHLVFQSYKANFVYPADPRNPYVYAQTSPDFLKLVHRVEDAASHHPDQHNILIKVVAGPYETWPIPWYLRDFDRVGYWTSAGATGDIDQPPLIIASAEEALRLELPQPDIYQSEYYGLRPGVLLVLLIRTDLWNSMMEPRSQR
jgi:uncharacterized protein (TIGR03663 family)